MSILTLEAFFGKLDNITSKEVQSLNSSVGNLLIGALVITGCFVLVFTGKGSPEAAFSMITMITGYYFGASRKPKDKPNGGTSG